MKRYGHYISGAWSSPSSGQWLPTVNPFTGKEWASIARGNAADVDAAVVSAHSAFHSAAWTGLSAAARGKVLYHFSEAIADHAEELAEIEVTDNGKLTAEVGIQCRLLEKWVAYYAGMADKIEGRLPPIDKPNHVGMVHYDPYGVCAGITPWNSPLLLLIWKLAPALAAGNTFVAKPSEFTSVSTLRLAEIAVEAGVPPGVFNVVTGLGPEVGAPLVRHPLVRRIAFTGGDIGGLSVARDAAEKLIPCTLELGGKSANIVFEDANVENAVNGIVSGIFAASGQTCMAGSRALIHRSLYDDVVAQLVKIAEAAKLGDPRDPSTNMGPIATESQYRKIVAMIDVAVDQGATLATGGPLASSMSDKCGTFIRPTILTNVKPNMRIFREEAFGPVLVVLPFDSEDEAVRIANDSDFGLAAGIWTRDIARGLRVSRQIDAGTVWINTYRSTNYSMPFGGFKKSGIGRENGIEAIKEYLQQKSVLINLSEAPVMNPFIRR